MIRFDDALRVLCEQLAAVDELASRELTLVRDVAGRLTTVAPNDALVGGRWNEVAASLHKALGAFSPGPLRVLLAESDLIDPDDVLTSSDRVALDDGTSGPRFLVDRLLTNQDWIRTPLRTKPRLPTLVGYSIKGGVGRTTALIMAAWDLARAGKRVLLVDLDLEAPGIGPALLSELPDLGVIDWCVESLVGQADDALFERMWSRAPLAAGVDGEIWVVPAHGAQSTSFVAKLGRAYLPVARLEGRSEGLSFRFDALIEAAARRLEPPDVVLLDARAGLHDIGSAAVTQLGAEVLLFARDDRQSWEAYARLFAHLKHARSVHHGMPDDDLRWRLKMVAAQVDPTEGATAVVVGHAYAAWQELYDADSSASPLAFSSADDAAPHYPLKIGFEGRIRSLDLIDPEMRPEWSFIESVFGELFAGVRARLLEES